MLKTCSTFLGSLALSTMLLAGCQASSTTADQADAKSSTQPSVQAASQPQAQERKTAEAQGWELVFHDTFDRTELGEHWQAINGQWEIKEGLLYGSGTLISAHAYPKQPPAGYQRLEFEAMSNIKPLMLLPGVKPKVVLSDMDALIHAQPYTKGDKNTLASGYFFQFGGFNNSVNRVRQLGDTLWEEKDPKTTIELDTWHHIVAENDQGTLRFFVDGQRFYEEKLTTITMGTGQDHVGMYFMTAVKIRDVKVYVKRLPNDLDIE